MVDNIKNLWSLMLNDTKQSVIEAIINESTIEAKSNVAITQNWIYKGLIPEHNQEKVLEICQNALKIQNERLSKALA